VLRIGRVGANTPNLYWTGSALQLRQDTTPVITLDSDGTSYFAGAIGLGAAGGIYQGTGSFATPTTGLKIWRDSGVGRIAGYNGGNEQWSASSAGKLTAGGGNVVLDASGVRVNATLNDSSETYTDYLRFDTPASGIRVGALSQWWSPVLEVSYLRIAAYDSAYGYMASLTLKANSTGSTAGSASFNVPLAIAGTLGATGAVTFSSTLAVTGAVTLGAPIDTASGVALELKQDTTSILRSQKDSNDAYLQLGNGRTASGLAYIDLVGDTTYTNYGLRLIRGDTGANATSQLLHRGTGNLDINAFDAADLRLLTSNTLRATVNANGIKVAASVAVGGDAGGTASYTTFTNATATASGAGGGTVKMDGATGRNNNGFVKAYVGTTAIYLPYWTTITG
jgi:hypothetical protein